MQPSILQATSYAYQSNVETRRTSVLGCSQSRAVARRSGNGELSRASHRLATLANGRSISNNLHHSAERTSEADISRQRRRWHGTNDLGGYLKRCAGNRIPTNLKQCRNDIQSSGICHLLGAAISVPVLMVDTTSVIVRSLKARKRNSGAVPLL